MPELSLTDLPLRHPTGMSIAATAAKPAFGELRNAMQVLFASVAVAQMEALEAPPGTKERLGESLQIIERSSARLLASIHALESLILPASGEQQLLELVTTAAHLSHHFTKLVGGLRIGDVGANVGVVVPRGVAIASVGAATAALASLLHERKHDAGVQIEMRGDANLWTVDVRGPELDARERKRLERAIVTVATAHPCVRVFVHDHGVRIELTRESIPQS